MAGKTGIASTILACAGVAALEVLGAIVTRLPPPCWAALAHSVASGLWIAGRKYRRRAVKNLTGHGYPPGEARTIARKSFTSNVLVVIETLAVRRFLNRKGVKVETRVSPEAEAIFEGIRSGRETLALALSGHTGVWELQGAECARLVKPATMVVAAALGYHPILNAYMTRLRRRGGIKIIDRFDMLRYLLENVRKKVPHLHVFLCDQHFKGGMRVPFLGEDACTVPIPATIIVKYDPPVILGRCVRRAAGDYLVEFDALDKSPLKGLSHEDAVRTVIAATNGYLEKSIALAPEQWTWGHKRWRTCCTADRRDQVDGEDYDATGRENETGPGEAPEPAVNRTES